MTAVSAHQVDSCLSLAEGLEVVGYRRADPSFGQAATWRVSPEPLVLSADDIKWFCALGQHLYRFTAASNELYMGSASGRLPGWVCEYLDQGKPPALIEYQRMHRLRNQIPTVMRPDVIPTSAGMMITELDSVPGGMGVTDRLAELYAEQGHQTLLNGHSILEEFAAMVRVAGKSSVTRLAIIVSEESEAYRMEMTWLGDGLRRHGVEAVTVKPHELHYTEDGVFFGPEGNDERVDVVYRFFELFDLPNIAKIELLMYLNKKRRVAVVPPFRPLFEEKIWLALLHHPLLSTYWRRELGDDAYAFLCQCFPLTWILDPTSVPAHATIPGLFVNGSAVNSWGQLKNLGRSERHLVIKPSGFSALAWGGRGVVIGHDVSTAEWNEALDSALAAFPSTPYVLQEFRSGSHFEGRYYEPDFQSIRSIPCRVRLCPYYFVVGDEVRLTSILATMCPLEKKKIHGMPEAILVPCAIDVCSL